MCSFSRKVTNEILSHNKWNMFYPPVYLYQHQKIVKQNLVVYLLRKTLKQTKIEFTKFFQHVLSTHKEEFLEFYIPVKDCR